MNPTDPTEHNGGADKAAARLFLPLSLVAPGPATEPGPSCLSDDTIAGLADGAIDEEARALALRHLATCARCRGALASVARALRDPEIAAEIAAAETPRRRRWLGIALPLAAAATLILVVWPRMDRDRAIEHRAPSAGVTAAPVLAAPVGLVAPTRLLRWQAVSGADRYRVVLFAADGRVLYETQQMETSALLPDSVTLVPGDKYLWKVEARVGWNRWSPSPLVEFSFAKGIP